MIERWQDFTHLEPSWKGIPGFFDFQEVYDDIAKGAKDGQTLVEVGCLLGRSACYLGEKLQARGVKATLLCVDAWPSTYMWGPDKRIAIEAPFEIFYANVRQAGLQRIVVPIRAASTWAARFVKNDLDFVFIDAEHDYANCKADILAWLPKVRKGGVIAGHDHDSTFPGVVQAVREVFGAGVTVRGRTWVVVV